VTAAVTGGNRLLFRALNARIIPESDWGQARVSDAVSSAIVAGSGARS